MILVLLTIFIFKWEKQTVSLVSYITVWVLQMKNLNFLRWRLGCKMFIRNGPWNWYLWKGGERSKIRQRKRSSFDAVWKPQQTIGILKLKLICQNCPRLYWNWNGSKFIALPSIHVASRKGVTLEKISLSSNSPLRTDSCRLLANSTANSWAINPSLTVPMSRASLCSWQCCLMKIT